MTCSTVLTLLLSLSLGCAIPADEGATRSEGPPEADLDCIPIRKELFHERKQCITKFMEHQIRNSTADTSEPNRNCTDLSLMENYFAERFNNYSKCFGNNSDTVISSLKIRLKMLNVTREELFKGFSNGILKCVKENAKYIQDNCLKKAMYHATNSTSLKDSISRAVPFLHFGQGSCGKNDFLLNCTNNILSKRCPESNAKEFVAFMQNIIFDDHCKNFVKPAANVPLTTEKKSKNTAGITIGVLVGVMAVLALGQFAIKKYKQSKAQPESYAVNFQNQPNEK